MIRNWPLSMKIWSVFLSLTLAIFGILAAVLPWLLKDFFTEQIYNILADSQMTVRAATAPVDNLLLMPAIPVVTSPGEAIPIQPAAEGSIQIQLRADMPVVNHFAFRLEPTGALAVPPGAAVVTTQLPEPFIRAIQVDANRQEAAVQRYMTSIENQQLFYVIRKEQLGAAELGYSVSFAWGNYRNDMVMTMYRRLVLVMFVLILASWAPCVWLARYVSKPLVQMQRHVGQLADRNWHEPLETGRRDEIGRLAAAIEAMRRRLQRQDEAQQSFLQSLSHELKTPVMVIRSFAQSMLDGIYPKGTLQASVEVVLHESERLEKRVRDLLYLNKINYMNTRPQPGESFDLRALIHDVVDRLGIRRPELSWELELPELHVVGQREQWAVAIENMLDNQLRYARSLIRVSGEAAGPSEWALRIWNDGPALDSDGSTLFELFHTGSEGQFGLGLAIVKGIVEGHRGTVKAVNEDSGVAYRISVCGSNNRVH